MELAIFAVLVLGISAGVWGYFVLNVRINAINVSLVRQNQSIREDIDISKSVMNVLSEASRIKAQRANPPETVFEKASDKIPASGQRYIPVARRRAMAEAQSAGPGTHNDQVRANNAKVLETL